jgi:hypothetical protein
MQATALLLDRGGRFAYKKCKKKCQTKMNAALLLGGGEAILPEKGVEAKKRGEKKCTKTILWCKASRLEVWMRLYVYMYTYINTCIYVYMYIYTYVYMLCTYIYTL